MTNTDGVLEDRLLEYDHCPCSKINKEVTITSMVIKESNEAAAPGRDDKQAFDCDQKTTLWRAEHFGERKIN